MMLQTTEEMVIDLQRLATLRRLFTKSVIKGNSEEAKQIRREAACLREKLKVFGYFNTIIRVDREEIEDASRVAVVCNCGKPVEVSLCQIGSIPTLVGDCENCKRLILCIDLKDYKRLAFW